MLVTDFPEPALLEEEVDFLVQVTNAGPDAATSVNLNIVGDGGLQFVSIAPAAGFMCTNQAVGATPLMTCSTASLANGAQVEFLVTLRSDRDQLGDDGGVVATYFGVNNSRADPSPLNNEETEMTTVETSGLFYDGFEG